MKTNFICPGCSQTLPAAAWFISTRPTVVPIKCNSCGRKLKLQKRAVALALLAMVPAIWIALWELPHALGLWNKEVPVPIFIGSMALMAAIYLPTSWMLIVNFSKWNIIEDGSGHS